MNNEYETEFYYFVSGRSGLFTTRLIQAMMVADTDNFLKLQQSFPGFCDVVWKYKNVLGYWEELQSRISSRDGVTK